MSPEPGGWSVNDVLAHLRACNDVVGGNVLRILAEDTPRWKGVNPRAWIKQTDYPQWEVAPAFAAFRRQRTEILAVLEPVPADAWDRIAVVTGMLGETDERTARHYAARTARHERGHMRHIGGIIRAVQATT